MALRTRRIYVPPPIRLADSVSIDLTGIPNVLLKAVDDDIRLRTDITDPDNYYTVDVNTTLSLENLRKNLKIDIKEELILHLDADSTAYLEMITHD